MTFLAPFWTRFREFAVTVPGRLRHPTKRGVLLGLAAIPALLVLYVLLLIPFTPSISDLQKAKTAKPSVVMSVDGEELASFKRANREWVKLEDISPNVVAALIATEDHRFYDHHGMDIKRTVSSVFHTLTGRKQGGSTITQQLARNLYPEDIGRAATLTRKLKEAITAFKIEAVYTKDEILESYLNTVPFLYNAYGIEMAARTYFDKSAEELDVLQSATLVGMLKGASYYNPVTSPDRALQRRNIVLAQMVKHQKLPEDKFAALKKQPLKIDFERQEFELGAAPHLAQQLRRWLIEWADRNDYNIYADGLVVHTTVDSRLQAMANAAVTRQGDRLQKIATSAWGGRNVWQAKAGSNKELVQAWVRDTAEYKAARTAGKTDEDVLKALQADTGFMDKLRDEKTRIQAGFLALNPSNGHVMAWVGSRHFADDQFDHVASARRQPGSTFKPFVYGAAFEAGAKPYEGFMDGPVEIPLGNGAFWRPTDGSGPSNEMMTLRQGLMFSKNTITAQLMHVVGPANVAKLAKAMGVRQSKLEEVPSLALGTSPVTLKEMVSAYSTIANDGRYIEPILITRVEDRNGKVLEEFQPKLAETAMSAPAAETLLDVMRGVIDQGTGAGIRSRYGIRADVAGKTGTTQDNTDGWFILMHPQLVAGAWAGFNDNRVTMGNGWGPGAQSALPMVGEFFQQAIKAKVIDAQVRFPVPEGSSVIDPSIAQGTPVEAQPPAEPPTENPAAVANSGAIGPVWGAAAPAEPARVWQPAPVIKYVTINVPGAAPVNPAAIPSGNSPAADSAQPMQVVPGAVAGAGQGQPGVVLPPVETRRPQRIDVLEPPAPDSVPVVPGVVVGAPIAPR
ncbi:penicillin-binding protein 1A [Polaromonas sp. YR568]|uniref:penicillin-binding protein 1A n=1 Tax=Polaromonas sp. YR568 TaxID=1855301 RepID=UPI0020C92E74|nr:transglycosylase domain-containing protein [Polaromonas sp. YR568]